MKNQYHLILPCSLYSEISRLFRAVLSDSYQRRTDLICSGLELESRGVHEFIMPRHYSDRLLLKAPDS